MIRALISAEMLPLRQPSSTIMARRVLRTEPSTAARSHGQQLAYYENENGSHSNGSDHHQFALE